MSLTLNIPKYVALHSNSNTPPSTHHKWKVMILYAKQPMGIIGDQLPMKSPIELEDKL